MMWKPEKMWTRIGASCLAILIMVCQLGAAEITGSVGTVTIHTITTVKPGITNPRLSLAPSSSTILVPVTVSFTIPSPIISTSWRAGTTFVDGGTTKTVSDGILTTFDVSIPTFSISTSTSFGLATDVPSPTSDIETSGPTQTNSGAITSQSTSSTTQSTNSTVAPTQTAVIAIASKKSSNARIIIGIVIGLLVLLALVLGAIFYIRRRNQNRSSKTNSNAGWYINRWNPGSDVPMRTSTIASVEYAHGSPPPATTEYKQAPPPIPVKNPLRNTRSPPNSPPRRPPRPESLSESMIDTMRSSPPPRTKPNPHLTTWSSIIPSPTLREAHEMTILPVQRLTPPLSPPPLRVVKRASDKSNTQQDTVIHESQRDTFRQYQHETLNKNFPETAAELAGDGHESDGSGNSNWTDDTRHTAMQDPAVVSRERERQKALAELDGLPVKDAERYKSMRPNYDNFSNAEADRKIAERKEREREREEERQTGVLGIPDWQQSL